MTIYSTNPTTGERHHSFALLTDQQLQEKIAAASDAYIKWQTTDFALRSQLFRRLAQLLRDKKEAASQLMALEMGKRLSDGRAEIDKCAWVCEYYADAAPAMMRSAMHQTEAQESRVQFEPLGVVLAVMPWNFPFWQVFRAAAPAMMAGNTMVLKHASSVPESALLIEQLFQEAGAPMGTFQTLLISSSQIEQVIADERVRMVSLTGSEAAGSSVAGLAGKHIKKSVLELGGSDPFIVCADADVEQAAVTAAAARMIVSGQSCIAAKRFLVHESVAEAFTNRFVEILKAKKVGDPLDEATEVGPLASAQAVQGIDAQVQASIELGAQCVLGGKPLDGAGFFYPPTVLTQVTPEMPVFHEETFGPVAAITSFASDEQALKLANMSRYGLGASVWTADRSRAEFFIDRLQSGAVFVNAMVKSDPRLPFGGSKFSGYGRELAEYGLREFVNIKSVWIA